MLDAAKGVAEIARLLQIAQRGVNKPGGFDLLPWTRETFISLAEQHPPFPRQLLPSWSVLSAFLQYMSAFGAVFSAHEYRQVAEAKKHLKNAVAEANKAVTLLAELPTIHHQIFGLAEIAKAADQLESGRLNRISTPDGQSLHRGRGNPGHPEFDVFVLLLAEFWRQGYGHRPGVSNNPDGRSGRFVELAEQILAPHRIRAADGVAVTVNGAPHPVVRQLRPWWPRTPKMRARRIEEVLSEFYPKKSREPEKKGLARASKL